MQVKNNEKKVQKTTAPEQPQPQLRKIVLETDGNMVRVSVNETAGNLELVSALQAVLALIANGK